MHVQTIPDITQLQRDALALLARLIETPSFSGQEADTAHLLETQLHHYGITTERYGNNIIARSRNFNAALPVILLNSHHDTVKPNPAYTRNPFEATTENGKLYGLGSNDAGGALVALLATFVHFYHAPERPFNLVFAATAEEENSGPDGVESVLKKIGAVDFAIVGEPTQMQLAVAEKGLLVLDCVAQGKAGHAAREEGINAIYEALPAISWFQQYRFEKVSDLLGPVKMSVTQINSGSQHNVVPAECRFTVDIRINECYTHEEILAIINAHVSCHITPRSMRMRSSSVPLTHPVVQAGVALGRSCYGSPTTSDQALLPYPSLKMGPGDSARSHSADEFIYVHEIENGITLYIELLNKIKFC